MLAEIDIQVLSLHTLPWSEQPFGGEFGLFGAKRRQPDRAHVVDMTDDEHRGQGGGVALHEPGRLAATFAGASADALLSSVSTSAATSKPAFR